VVELSDISARLREVRTRADARRAAVEEGRAPSELYEARDTACEVVGDALTDDARDYITTLVIDTHAKAERTDEPFDAGETGEKVGREVARVLDFQRKGGIAGWVERMRFPYASVGGARLDLAAARPERIKREPVEMGQSPIADWRAESADRADRQIDALERLVDHAEAQGKDSRINLAVSAVAAVSGVAAVVIALLSG
jgi:hypothetical protein